MGGDARPAPVPVAMSSDGDEGGGTFWSSFGKTVGADAEGTPLERLLQSPDCSVEALLDEEDVIQEFKAQNDRLVSRLCKPDAAKALIKYITCEPPDGSSHERCFRYPFVAVELMTCGADSNSFFESFFGTRDADLMDTFWGFLEVSPPAKVNPVLAGYFARAAAALLAKHRREVAEHLRIRDTDALLQRFLDRLHLRSIAELFARLLCVEQAFQMIFLVEGLVERLLSRLLDSVPANDTQENVALITLELLAHKETLVFSDDLLEQLTSSKVVNLLVDGVFCGRPGSVVASAAILSSVISHTHVAPKGGGASSIPGSTPTLSPLSPPMAPPPLSGDDDVVNVGDDGMESIAGQCEAAPLRAAVSPPASPTAAKHAETSATVLDRGAVLIREVCTHMPRIRALLDAALNPGVSKVLQMPVGAANAVGSTTLEVINLLTMLVRTGSPFVFEALLQDELLPRCLELFFRHKWSSLLHNAVRLLLSEVLGGTEGQRSTLVLRLLQEGGLAKRLVSEYEAEWGLSKMSEGLKLRHPRVGYMGHLHAMCTELRSYGSQVPEVGAALTSTTGWTESVIPALSATDKIQSEALGGGIPDEDRGLASSNVPSSRATSGFSATGLKQDGLAKLEDDPVEYKEFVLNPLDEDIEDELGGLHMDEPKHLPCELVSASFMPAGVADSGGDGPQVFPVLSSAGMELPPSYQAPNDSGIDHWVPLFPDPVSAVAANADDRSSNSSPPAAWRAAYLPESEFAFGNKPLRPPPARSFEEETWADFRAAFDGVPGDGLTCPVANQLPASSAPQAADRNDRSWVADFDPFSAPVSSGPGPGVPSASSGGYGGGAVSTVGGGDKAVPEPWVAHFPDPPFEAPPPPPRPNEPDEDPLPFIHAPAGVGRSATTTAPSSTTPPPATSSDVSDLSWWPADFGDQPQT